MALIEEKELEIVINHAKETAQTQTETKNILPKGEFKNEDPLEENKEHVLNENKEPLNFDIPKAEKRGRKKGSKNRSTIEETEPLQKPKIAADILLNSIILEPTASFFLKDASLAMYTKEQGDILNALAPLDDVKPSWTSFLTIGLLMGAGNFLKAFKYEKSHNIISKTNYTNEDIMLIVNSLKPEQLEFMVNDMLRAYNQLQDLKKKEEIKDETKN